MKRSALMDTQCHHLVGDWVVHRISIINEISCPIAIFYYVFLHVCICVVSSIMNKYTSSASAVKYNANAFSGLFNRICGFVYYVFGVL